ncbi:MAG: Taurine catabolism dioxygenase TauD/TfdA [Acidimicrobiales bacterium]|nr:Taurine catabolism dioxygenase TauD/TfdA [Acidimicrobiales bacterium]
MTATPRVLEPQCAWSSSDVADEAKWTECFADAELAELETALRHALTRSADVLQLGRDDFPLPTLDQRLERIEHDLVDGRGFVRLRGVDRQAYTQAEMEVLYWGIGTHLGLPWAQNKHGHVLGDVIDQHKAIDDPTARGNELGGIALPFHCDGSDLVGLLCLENGREGGLSAVANSVRIHNQLVAERPDLAAALYDPLPYDYRGEQPPGGRPYYLVPVFTEWDGRLFVRCIPPYIWASQRHPEAPRLNALQREALEAVVHMADDPANHVLMDLQPGDMQFINNYHVLHGRTAYEDDRASGRVRHLKRLWLETPMLTSRPPFFANDRSHWSENRTASRITVD